MLVSVIIPVYNRINSLRRSIESVFCQTFKGYEIIVIDDGSDLYSVDNELRPYISRLKLIRLKTNKGPSYARNTGIKASKGQYIAFLDSDDIWLPFKLEMQLDILEKDSNKFICHCDEFWYKNGKYINKTSLQRKITGSSFIYMLDKCRVSPSTVLLRKAVFNKIGFFDPNLPVCEDYDFFLRLAIYYNFIYINIPSIVKVSEEKNQLSKHIKHIEYIRLKILLNLLKKQKHLPFSYQSAILKEINRKFNIVKSGVNKKN